MEANPTTSETNMSIDLPNDIHVGLKIIDYFSPGARIIKYAKRGLEKIALIKNPSDNLGPEKYYAVVYHDNGYVICLYSQTFESMLGGLVIYKKLKTALESGRLEDAWHELIIKSKRN